MTKTKRFKFTNSTVLKDALYNLHPATSTPLEYCTGMLVGIVAAYIAVGMSMHAALDTVAFHAPDGLRILAFPESWRKDVVDILTSRDKLWVGDWTA